MPRKLLLPSAKSGVLLESPRPALSPWWRRAALLFGLAAVLVGGADVVSRLAYSVAGERALFSAFAPGVLLIDPSLEAQVQGTRTTSVVPARVQVTSLGIDAPVEQVGKKTGGDMAAPKLLSHVGWYKLGSKPGEQGNAVFAGHVNNGLGFGGVFENLSKIATNDTVVVVGEDGESLVYVVERITVYDKDAAPLDEIFASTGPSRVVLITCEGEWQPAAGTFDKRLVVVAKLKTP